MDLDELVVVEQGLTKLSLHSGSLLHQVPSEAERGVNPFEVTVKAELPGGE